MTTVSIETVEGLACKALVEQGTPQQVAARVVRELVDNEITGYPSHGLLRLFDYIIDISERRLIPTAVPTSTRRSPEVSHIEGQKSFGILVADAIVSELKHTASVRPIAAACVSEAHHLGRLAPIGRLLSSDGLVVMGFCNFLGRGLRVAAPDGTLPRLCTNPVVFAFPSAGPDPFVLDMSTSVVSEGFVRQALLAGDLLPEGLLVGKGSSPIRDPSRLYTTPPEATMTSVGSPLAAHKGYSLAVFVELLVGALVGTGHVAGPSEPGNGGLFLAINPAFFSVDLGETRRVADAIISHCRQTGESTRLARLPGDLYKQRLSAARARGMLDLASDTLERLKKFE